MRSVNPDSIWLRTSTTDPLAYRLQSLALMALIQKMVHVVLVIRVAKHAAK